MQEFASQATAAQAELTAHTESLAAAKSSYNASKSKLEALEREVTVLNENVEAAEAGVASKTAQGLEEEAKQLQEIAQGYRNATESKNEQIASAQLEFQAISGEVRKLEVLLHTFIGVPEIEIVYHIQDLYMNYLGQIPSELHPVQIFWEVHITTNSTFAGLPICIVFVGIVPNNFGITTALCVHNLNNFHLGAI